MFQAGAGERGQAPYSGTPDFAEPLIASLTPVSPIPASPSQNSATAASESALWRPDSGTRTEYAQSGRARARGRRETLPKLRNHDSAFLV